jgi:hypothetical protein
MPIFLELGLDPTILMGRIRSIEDKLRMELDSSALLEYQTIYDLSRYLVREHKDKIGSYFNVRTADISTINDQATEISEEPSSDVEKKPEVKVPKVIIIPRLDEEKAFDMLKSSKIPVVPYCS